MVQHQSDDDRSPENENPTLRDQGVPELWGLIENGPIPEGRASLET